MRERIERHQQEHEHGRVEPPRPETAGGEEMQRELGKGVWGPGALGTRSQLLGGLWGTISGGLLGALLGLLIGLALFAGETTSIVITVIVGALAGSTALGIAGGFVYNRGKQERGEPDV